MAVPEIAHVQPSQGGYPMKRLLLSLSLCLLAATLFAASGLAADGKSLYARCSGCHGPDGAKKAMGAAKAITGMKSAAVKKALEGYLAKTYGGEKKAMMEGQVKGLTPADIQALSDYIASL